MRKIRRAAIRYQNVAGAKGNYTPSMAEAIAAILDKKGSANDTDTRSSRSNGEAR